MSETTEPVRVPPAPEKESSDRWNFRRWAAVVVALALVGAGVLIGTQIADDGQGEIDRLEQEMDVAQDVAEDAQAAQQAAENRPPETPQACPEALGTAEALILLAADGIQLLSDELALALEVMDNSVATTADDVRAIIDINAELAAATERAPMLRSVYDEAAVDCRAAR